MNRKLLYKYFKGDCTASETKEVLQWYANVKFDPDLDQEIHELFEANYKASETSWDKDAVFQNILEQIENAPEISFEVDQKKIGNKNTTESKIGLLKIASVVVLAILACGIFLLSKTERFQTDNTAQVGATKPSYITKQTTKGQKSKLNLPDGTQIVLNAGSKLWFANTFSTDNERTVYLEGEAFFDVTRDTTRPFVIHAKNTVTRVLGTSFNVNAYTNNQTVSVAVVSGQVSVKSQVSSNNAQSVYLEPGEKAVCDVKEEVKIKKALFSYDQEIVWKDGTLTFYKEDFEAVAEKLEMWYGKKFIIKKTGIRDDFTGTYHNKSLETVLEGISYVLGFDYEMKDNKVIIK